MIFPFLATIDTEIKSSVEGIISIFAIPARILGGVFILVSILLVAYELIIRKNSEKRAQSMESMLYVCLAAFILGLILEILGFFNKFMG